MASRRVFRQNRFPGRDDDGAVASAFINGLIEGEHRANRVHLQTTVVGEREVTVISENDSGEPVRATVRVPVTKVTGMEFDEPQGQGQAGNGGGQPR